MSKISRGFRINRELDAKTENDWANALEHELNKIDKQAVKSKDTSVSSLFNQINSIVNRKSKYSSVEAAVKEMQERSGYASYLRKVESDTEKTTSKIAQTPFATENPHANIPQHMDDSVSDDLPTVIKNHPAIKSTLENCISDTHGFLPIPAIISRIKAIHGHDISDDSLWEEEKFIRYVGNLNLKEKSNHEQYIPEHNLGKSHEMSEDVNDANSSFFGGCEPQKH
jgi:hypothetical protein